MANPFNKNNLEINKAEHISPDKTGDNIEAKRIANYVWNEDTGEWERMTQPSGSSSGGDASAANQVLQITEAESTNTKLDSLISGQLPDGHNVTVDNLPTEYPLPSSQVTTLTPQTDALTDTELRAAPVPISGTVTANTGLTQPTTPSDTQPISASSLPLPTGAATSANQTTANTALSAIQTAIELLDNIVSGSEAQVDIVAALPAGSNAIGSVNTSPTTSGGWDSVNMTAADGATALTNSAQQIKDTAGKFGGYYIYNPNTSAQWVHIYNVVDTSVTVGTTNPQLTFLIPAESAANLELTNGIAFSTAMSVAATSTAGGNGAPTSPLEACFWYK